MCGDAQSFEAFKMLFWENSVYTMVEGDGTNTFTRVDASISDPDKLSGTWVYEDSPSELYVLTYLDETTDSFAVTYDADDNQIITHVEQNNE